MKITSSVFENNGAIPAKYSCDGDGINPPLEFSEVPEQVKSLALIVDDPDAPSGDFVHWVVWNIDPKSQRIPEGSIPAGARIGLNSLRNQKWVAPCPPCLRIPRQDVAGEACPPSGSHRYFFKLYALDIDLNIPENTDKYQLLTYMDNHILTQAELIGLYTRGASS